MIVPQSGPVTIKTNLADSALVAPLKAGKIDTGAARLDFCGPKTANEGFKPMLREQVFGAGELAIVTLLQAHAYGKPYVLLPATMVGRFQHHTIAYAGSPGEKSPKDLEGGRVGVRSYSQTTGVWVRAILQHEYGVDLDTITWCVHDAPHVAEADDPPNVERFALQGRTLAGMLLAGEFDAAILGNELPNDPRAQYLIPDPHKAAEDWTRRIGIVPINHVFVVHAELAAQRPDAVRDIYWALQAAKEAYKAPAGEVDCLPFGVEAMAPSVDAASRFAFEQKLIPRQISADEVLETAARLLS